LIAVHMDASQKGIRPHLAQPDRFGSNQRVTINRRTGKGQLIGIHTSTVEQTSSLPARYLPTHAPVPYGGHVSRSSLALAALATVAIPGFEPVAAKGVQSSTDFDLAKVVDARKTPW